MSWDSTWLLVGLRRLEQELSCGSQTLSDPRVSDQQSAHQPRRGYRPLTNRPQRTFCNQGNSGPSQTSLCRPGSAVLDPQGNLYVLMLRWRQR